MEKQTAQCCIDTCPTKSKAVKVKDIIYYLFPSDEEWAAAWEKRLKEYNPRYRRTPDDLLCSLHFAKNSMDAGTRQLADHALPVYFLQTNTQRQLSQAKPATVTATAAAGTTITTTTTPDGTKTKKWIPSHSILSSLQCCIDGCPTRFDDSDTKIRGFKFPDDAKKRHIWTWIIGVHHNQEIEWKETMRICALHFTDSSFIKPDQLTDDAKPCVFHKSATARRKSELEKQQARKQQQTNTMKMSSINVPLHRANAENQSMIRRSAPASINSRRLSLPFSRLPKLLPKPLPKPNIKTQVPSTQINCPNGGLMNVHLKNSQNIVLTSVSSAVKSLQRPVPALNKVINASNVIVKDGQQNLARPNMVLIRKAIRPSLPIRTVAATAAAAATAIKPVIPSSGSTLKPIKLPPPPGWVPVKPIPPSLTPAPQRLKLPVRTYSKNGNALGQLPVISQVQSIPMEQSNDDHTTPSIVQITNRAIASSPVPNVIRTKIMITEEDDPEMIRAINESKSLESMETDESTAANTSVINTNGTQKQVYVLRDENAFDYPKILLERVLQNKRKNFELESEVVKLKKLCSELRQETLAKRLEKATVSGTIEIS